MGVNAVAGMTPRGADNVQSQRHPYQGKMNALIEFYCRAIEFRCLGVALSHAEKRFDERVSGIRLGSVLVV